MLSTRYQLLLRDHLRGHPDDTARYGALKDGSPRCMSGVRGLSSVREVSGSDGKDHYVR